jgi:hypothetical protein
MTSTNFSADHIEELRRVERERKELASDDPWYPILSADVPASVRFDVALCDQGQIVEQAYGGAREVRSEWGEATATYLRIHDHSDDTQRYYRRRSSMPVDPAEEIREINAQVRGLAREGIAGIGIPVGFAALGDMIPASDHCVYVSRARPDAHGVPTVVVTGYRYGSPVEGATWKPLETVATLAHYIRTVAERLDERGW